MSNWGGALPEVVVTRARADAPALAQALREAGFSVCCLPLLDLQDMPAAQLQCDETQLLAARAIMVVSARAAGVFARTDVSLGAALRARWASGQGPRVWAPGLGTVKALLDAGVPEAHIDSSPADAAQFDSEHLWPQVRDQLSAGDQVVFLRGEGAVGGTGRDFLWQRCLDAGAKPQAVWVYRRGPPQWTAAESADAVRLSSDSASLWLFSSSLAVQHLALWRARDGAPISDWSQACAVVTHERIAQTARELGWGRVVEATPRLVDIVQGLHRAAATLPN